MIPEIISAPRIMPNITNAPFNKFSIFAFGCWASLCAMDLKVL